MTNLNKVIYKIKNAHFFEDGHSRVTHRLFVKVLTHEIIDMGYDHREDPDQDENEKLIEEKMNKVHLFRMIAVERDYSQNQDEYEKSQWAKSVASGYGKVEDDDEDEGQ